MQSSHTSFEEAEKQFDLPSVGIQEDDLEGGQVRAVGEDQEGGVATLKGNQPVGVAGGILGTADALIRQVGKEGTHGSGDGDRQGRDDLVAQVSSGAYDEESALSYEVLEEIEGEVAPIQDVRDACLRHAQEDFLLVGFPLGEEELDGDHAVQLEGEMKLDGMDVFSPLGPAHGGQSGEEGAIPATKQSQFIHFRDTQEGDRVEEGHEEALKDQGGEASEGISEGGFGRFGEAKFRGSTLHAFLDAPYPEIAFEDPIDHDGDKVGERHLLFGIFGKLCFFFLDQGEERCQEFLENVGGVLDLFS